MIYGIGVDIIEIERVYNIDKLLTESEKEYASTRKQETLAGMFAAKEATVKALGLGFRNITPNEIEILHDENNRPYVKLHGNAQKLHEHNEITNIKLSISHSKSQAIAFVVIEK